MDAVSEVRGRLNIEDVVSEYVQLKRAGRNLKGLSPFTNEKTPSFIVSPEKQIWHDFSSGKGGNVFGFIMEMEGLDFKGALELLADKAGVDLDQYRGRPGTGSQLKKRLLEALELATYFYQRQLTTSRPALLYLLKQRGFSKQTLIDWRLGYSPADGKQLVNFLTKRGFSQEEIRKAGLATERRGGLGDMFRGRIMIPLADSRGAVMGFTARLLNDEPNAPKYINTPSSQVYDKSRHVFGLHLAREQIRKSGFVVVAEGNLDVITSHQAGVANVVASSGTAMTEMHLKELRRFTSDIRLSFDTDQAGVAAAERIIPLAQKADVELKIITIKGAKDPDELIRKDAKAWQEAIQNSQYAMDWLIDFYAAKLDLKTAPGKRAFTDATLAVVRGLPDRVEQEHYLHRIAELTDSSFEAVQDKQTTKFSQAAYGSSLKKPKIQAEDQSQDADYRKLQDHFLSMVLMEPKLRLLLDNCQPDFFEYGPPRQLFDLLQKNASIKPSAAAKQLQDISDYVKVIMLQFEEIYQSLGYDDLLNQATRLKSRLVNSYTKTQKSNLTLAMQRTEDEAELAELMHKVDELNKLIK